MWAWDSPLDRATSLLYVLIAASVFGGRGEIAVVGLVGAVFGKQALLQLFVALAPLSALADVAALLHHAHGHKLAALLGVALVGVKVAAAFFAWQVLSETGGGGGGGGGGGYQPFGMPDPFAARGGFGGRGGGDAGSGNYAAPPAPPPPRAAPAPSAAPAAAPTPAAASPGEGGDLL